MQIVIVAKQERRLEDASTAGTSRVPVRRFDQFRNRGIHDPGAWGSGRGLKAKEGAPGEGPFRDDIQGGDPAESDDDYGQTYEGQMREYRGTTTGYHAVPKAHADGEPRPDQNIMEDVVDLLARDRGIDDEKIQVYVTDGVVVLEGQTCSHRSSNRAERLAKLVGGVTGVDNHVRIVVRSQ